MRRLFTAARVRKLDRIAVGYLVAAWVVVQAGSIALPAFEAPPWAMKLLIAGAVVGLPLTLLIAWFWRIGVEPDQPEDNAPHPIWGRTELLLVGLLAFVLVTGAIEVAFFFTPRNTTASPSGAKESLASIAVLPFANLSGDPSKRYFSDGIADQLISELSKTPALRVASRTSSFAVAQKNMDVKTLGKALNVKTVLEGSVREEGGRVRVAAQLVNASDGFEVWSNTYDRNLTDILSLQDEIARSITGALTQKLIGRKLAQVPHPRPRPIDPEAYRDYLQAQFFLAQRSEDSINRSIDLLTKVTERAPHFADGYATMANAHATLAFNFDQQTHIAPALYAVKQALALDANNITALAAHSTTSMLMWKFLNAAEDVRQMQRLAPNNPEVWHNSSIFYAYMGLPDLTLAAARRAVDLDPLSYIDRSNLALYSISSGDLKEATKLARDALALQPGNVGALAVLCETLAAAKQFEDARRILAQIASLTIDDPRVGDRAACQFWIAAYSGDKKVARQIVDEVAPGYPDNGVPAGDMSTGYRVIGDNDKALEWYKRALDDRDIAVLPTKYFAKGSRAVFDTPAWIDARNRPDVIAWENARVRIAREFGSKVSGS
jgi:TolB-like protein/tetratricopeptide (TPR) repeat protein